MKHPTRVNHPPEIKVPEDNRSLVAPIYQSVKFEFDTVEETERVYRGERAGFHYSRRSNPTVRQLEVLLAELQGREEALATSSGVAALGHCLLGLLKQGDHIIGFLESYGPTRHLVRRVLARFGVSHTLLSVDDLTGVEHVLAERPTRLVIFESPTNPVTKIVDIARLTAAARRHGALTLLDNTFAGFHNHGQYDIDFYVHSLTKYASGHGDVMGGAVIARAELVRALRTDFVTLGAVLDPHAAFLIVRGLKTYFLRCREQCANAMRVARYLDSHRLVERVHYPGLESHPQHALARAQMHDFGSIVSFDIRGAAQAGRKFADNLRLFHKAASLGSTESLVMAPQMLRPRDLTAEQLQLSGVGDGTIRLSIGIEDADDLLADLAQALNAL
ncbi:MAG TPA: aminotransferase class I/II-fold pyridoxal phosphate-dependent enzyme [Steroidobacteraceae bacterium]|nr:aminotransferase class I/II-fold pyridoxal phosphate-dependent enzyme [Steroidobacteraceae bacterium]